MKSFPEFLREQKEQVNEDSKFRDKMFKLWFGKSKEQVRKDVRDLSDEYLKILARGDWSKSGGAQKIQKDEIKKELERRGLSARIMKEQETLNEFQAQRNYDKISGKRFMISVDDGGRITFNLSKQSFKADDEINPFEAFGFSAKEASKANRAIWDAINGARGDVQKAVKALDKLSDKKIKLIKWEEK